MKAVCTDSPPKVNSSLATQLIRVLAGFRGEQAGGSRLGGELDVGALVCRTKMDLHIARRGRQRTGSIRLVKICQQPRLVEPGPCRPRLARSSIRQSPSHRVSANTLPPCFAAGRVVARRWSRHRRSRQIRPRDRTNASNARRMKPHFERMPGYAERMIPNQSIKGRAKRTEQ